MGRGGGKKGESPFITNFLPFPSSPNELIPSDEKKHVHISSFIKELDYFS
jgi:hypothetical protein